MAVALLVVFSSCTSTASRRANPDLLKLLEDGRTTREAIVLELGQPSATFEGARISTYRLGKGGDGYFVVEHNGTKWLGVKYSLVLVFDAQDVLARHSLVEVR